MRGPQAFETALSEAQAVLTEKQHATAAGGIGEALRDPSRRPDPDLTGAIHHALAALECVAREVTGDTRSTLGEIVKRRTLSLAPPLNQVIEKLWGYSSEYGRHLRERAELAQPDVALVVHVAAALSTRLLR